MASTFSGIAEKHVNKRNFQLFPHEKTRDEELIFHSDMNEFYVIFQIPV